MSPRSPTEEHRPPTITEVARRAGVSTATVSRVLNSNPKVDPVLAARARQAIEELGYEPSRVARSLRTRTSRVWALIIPDIRNPFFTDTIRGIEDVAHEEDYLIVLCNSESDIGKESGYMKLAVAEHMAGIILSPASQDTASALSSAHHKAVVTFDRRLALPFDWVGIDSQLGAEMATDHLIDNGYRRIACISGPTNTTTGADRLAGYTRALSRAYDDDTHSLIELGDFGETCAYEAMQRLLQLKEPPDAVFTANNLTTLGALRAIDERGLRVPDDIGVVGFDDLPWAPLVRTPVTTVSQPTYQLGVETARLLLSRINGNTGPARTVMLAPSLRVRASSTPREPVSASEDSVPDRQAHEEGGQPRRVVNGLGTLAKGLPR